MLRHFLAFTSIRRAGQRASASALVILFSPHPPPTPPPFFSFFFSVVRPFRFLKKGNKKKKKRKEKKSATQFQPFSEARWLVGWVLRPLVGRLLDGWLVLILFLAYSAYNYQGQRVDIGLSAQESQILCKPLWVVSGLRRRRSAVVLFRSLATPLSATQYTSAEVSSCHRSPPPPPLSLSLTHTHTHHTHARVRHRQRQTHTRAYAHARTPRPPPPPPPPPPKAHTHTSTQCGARASARTHTHTNGKRGRMVIV